MEHADFAAFEPPSWLAIILTIWSHMSRRRDRTLPSRSPRPRRRHHTGASADAISRSREAAPPGRSHHPDRRPRGPSDGGETEQSHQHPAPPCGTDSALMILSRPPSRLPHWARSAVALGGGGCGGVARRPLASRRNSVAGVPRPRSAGWARPRPSAGRFVFASGRRGALCLGIRAPLYRSASCLRGVGAAPRRRAPPRPPRSGAPGAQRGGLQPARYSFAVRSEMSRSSRLARTGSTAVIGGIRSRLSDLLSGVARVGDTGTTYRRVGTTAALPPLVDPPLAWSVAVCAPSSTSRISTCPCRRPWSARSLDRDVPLYCRRRCGL